jgi:hypothetical protein
MGSIVAGDRARGRGASVSPSGQAARTVTESADREAQTRTLRDDESAVRPLQPLLEDRFQPVEVLDPDVAGEAGREVHVDLHDEVRCQVDARIVGEVEDPDERGDAAHARSIRLEDVAGLRAQQCTVLVDGAEHLPGRDGCPGRCGECGVPLCVVRVQRFLDPREVVRLERARHLCRARARPLLVGVDHERGVPDVPAHGLDAPQVLPPVRLPDLDLDAADPRRQ